MYFCIAQIPVLLLFDIDKKQTAEPLKANNQERLHYASIVHGGLQNSPDFLFFQQFPSIGVCRFYCNMFCLFQTGFCQTLDFCIAICSSLTHLRRKCYLKTTAFA